MKALKRIGIVALFLTQSAWAHLELTTYSGETVDGKPCSVKVNSVAHEGGVHHPLRERVSVTIDKYTLELRHGTNWPDVKPLDFELDTGHLKGSFGDIIKANGEVKALTVAFEMVMSHDNGNEGPTAFRFGENYWDIVNNESLENKVIECLKLKPDANGHAIN